VNARQRPSSPKIKQVEFKLDYSGGWKHHRLTWKTFKNTCSAYDGPDLPWLVAACKASNGSYWALQSWQTALPDLGLAPWLGQQKTWWLHLSHWTGDLAQLNVYTDWIYGGRFQEVFGQYTYQGKGIRGFGTTRVGAPTDGYGRLLFLDTYNSSYGPGWLRENSFVSHGPPGMFCYGFYARNPWVGGYAHPRSTPNRKRGPGTGRAVPDHGSRAGGDAGRHVAGPRAAPVQQAEPRRRLARERDERRAGRDPRQLRQVRARLAGRRPS
jgi:hypothetical protein